MSTQGGEEEILVQEARAAMARAYAPYSQYPVGAAVLAEDGRIFAGVNVENASYPLSICAERTAVGAAVAAGVRVIRMVAVASGGNPAATPCGACRQVLAEFNPPLPDNMAEAHASHPSMLVLVTGQDGGVDRYRLLDLLPYSFGPDHLRRGL